MCVRVCVLVRVVESSRERVAERGCRGKVSYLFCLRTTKEVGKYELFQMWAKNCKCLLCRPWMLYINSIQILQTL